MIGAGIACLAGAVITAWLMWGPVLSFFLSLIPSSAEYAWVGHILVIGLVAYFGGVGLPTICLVFAGIFLFRVRLK